MGIKSAIVALVASLETGIPSHGSELRLDATFYPYESLMCMLNVWVLFSLSLSAFVETGGGQEREVLLLLYIISRAGTLLSRIQS
jgi:hypothetical protein